MDPTWALLATVGIWAGSSLPVYMYFNPFWSHAHSAFIVALFLWYWDHTRSGPELGTVVLLGADFRPAGGCLLCEWRILADSRCVESVELRERRSSEGCCRGSAPIRREPAYFARFCCDLRRLSSRAKLFLAGCSIRSVYGICRGTGISVWRSILFSSDHGMLSWTPLLIRLLRALFSVRARPGGSGVTRLAAVAFYYFIASYPYWDGWPLTVIAFLFP